MQQLQFYIIDAFIYPGKSFSGNPAAVVFLSSDTDLNDETKQNIAAQFNFAATVFISPPGESGEQFLIRWFTPTDELRLCGHGTLAATYALYRLDNPFTALISADKPLRLVTHYGAALEASIDSDQLITLTFPLNPPAPVSKAVHLQKPWFEQLQRALLGQSYTANSITDVQWSANQMLVLRLADGHQSPALEAIKPNFGELLQVEQPKEAPFTVLLLTKKADYATEQCHFSSRVFAPWIGVNEDAACGSALTVLAPFWVNSSYGRGLGVMTVKQASERRAQMMITKVDEKEQVVVIRARATLFASGQLD